MRHQDDRRDIVLDSRQRRRDIVLSGPQVADAREPYRASRGADPLRGLLHNADPVSLERRCT